VSINSVRIPSKMLNKVSFGHKMIIDIGASDPRGTVKLLSTTDNDSVLFNNNGFLSNKNFESEKDFIDTVSKYIVNACKQAEAKVEELKKAGNPNVSDKDQELSNLAILVPGPVVNNKIALIANIKTSNGQSMQDVETMKIFNALINQAQKEHINISRDINYVVAKDLLGTGISLASILAKHPQYKDKIKQGDFFAVGIMTGGGFGSVNIKAKDQKTVEIEASENSHNLAVPLSIDNSHKPDGEIVRIGKLGATAKGMLENYAKTLGITSNDDINAIVNTGNARMATLINKDGKNSISLNKNLHNHAIKLLLDTGVYKVKEEKDNNITLELKNDTNSLEKHKKARLTAIQKYVDAIAWHTICKITEGANLLILTGPLANGINKTIMDLTENKMQLKDAIFNKINSLVGDDNTINKLRKEYDFDIVCGGEFMIENNTTCAKTLLDKSSVLAGSGKRADWISLPIKTL